MSSSRRKIPWLARATEEREGKGIDSRLEKTAFLPVDQI